MTDHFAELGIPRAAWIDADEVKDRHHQLMASCHPDKIHGDGERSTRLNAARRALENPATRLRHLLELEFPAFQVTQKPQPDWDFFSKSGQVAKMAQVASSNLSSATTPLTRAVAQRQAAQALLAIEKIQDEIRHRELDLENRTRQMTSLPTDAQIVSDLAEEWTFLNRWKSVIQEARTAL